LITNSLLRTYAPQVFSFTTAISVDTIFSDREESGKELHEKISKAAGRATQDIVLVSEIPETGKTRFLRKIASLFGVKKTIRIPSARDMVTCFRYEDFETMVKD
jgi:tRNA A37 threonylcarbamoyladenosine biosynthesis protein TsaE